MQIKIKNKTLKFEHFPVKESNFRKIKIHFDNKDVEGIWACFKDEDLLKYDNDSLITDYETVVILVNDALAFYPNSSWGAYLPIKFNGSERPDLNLTLMKGKMQFCQEKNKK